jgi:hypothetical protein
MRNLLVSLTLTSALSLPVAAHAATFNLTFTDSSGSNSVSLTGNATGTVNQYLITGASGTIDGLNVTLLAPGTYPSNDSPNDNLLSYPTTPYLDFSGIAFELGTTEFYNLYANGNNYYEISGPSSHTTDTGETSYLVSNVSVTPAATPEPGSIALLGTGLLGAAGMVRRRFAL